MPLGGVTPSIAPDYPDKPAEGVFRGGGLPKFQDQAGRVVQYQASVRIELNTNEIISRHGYGMNFSGENNLEYVLDGWRYLLGKPHSSGVIRSQPEDFQVEEELGFMPIGEGEHLWINISKRLMNTQEVVSTLSKATGVARKDIGYSGQKDRNAVASQWFSLQVGNRHDEIVDRLGELFRSHGMIALKHMALHTNKLKRGVHRSNRFRICVREFEGCARGLEGKIQFLCSQGAPNYFGPQRFGRGGRNILLAKRIFNGTISKVDRNARGMALSAARAWIFNRVLSGRLGTWEWNEPVSGDAMQLDGSNAFFVHDGSDPAVVDRIGRHDLHITGPMWGQGSLPTKGNVAEFELCSVKHIRLLPQGLERAGLHQQRRALRMVPRDLNWRLGKDRDLYLEFVLNRGSYATALLRELVEFSE